MNLEELRAVRDRNPIGSENHTALQWAIGEIERLQHEFDMHEDFTEDKDLWVKPMAIELDGLASVTARAATLEEIYSLDDGDG